MVLKPLPFRMNHDPSPKLRPHVTFYGYLCGDRRWREAEFNNNPDGA